MGKNKQSKVVEQPEQKVSIPVPTTTTYKPIPKFKSGCSNC